MNEWKNYKQCPFCVQCLKTEELLIAHVTKSHGSKVFKEVNENSEKPKKTIENPPVSVKDEVVPEEMGMKKPYVFKCTSCISAFHTKNEVDEHIFKVHKWNISGVNSNHTV